MAVVRVRVRAGRAGDGPVLRDIEWAAGERFRQVGLGQVADAEPFPLDVLAGYAADGRSWVAVASREQAIGYALAEVVDGNGHVEQVSVRPDWQGRGVGRTLIDAVAAWARGRGLRALTLTTFADVPWNGPLYEHLGFAALDPAGWGPELRAKVEAEAAEGLDPALRVCMIRSV